MKPNNHTRKVTFETEQLRQGLACFLDHPWAGTGGLPNQKVGDFKFGVYAFFDYDLEPIYVGQTRESLRSRIGRHLTNQRTDPVAMNVLDPFEVFEIEVWPLPGFEGRKTDDQEARIHLDALEHLVHERETEKSRFGAVLNEKPPPTPKIKVELPESFRRSIVSEKVFELRAHPDYRIARRSQVLARLAQVVAERKVKEGLRHTLWVQAKRLEWLAAKRLREDRGEG